LKIAFMNMEIASKNFVIDTSQARVWRLIGKVIFSSLTGMEEVEILDERNFRAILKEKFLFLNLKMKLKGEIAEINPPYSITVNLLIEGPWNILKMNQRVKIEMVSVDKDKTSLACKSIAEGMGIIFRMFFFKKAQDFSKSVFETIEKRLKEFA